MILNTGERQHATALDKVKPNHLYRYQWAIDELSKICPGGYVLDAACGVGYGAFMLAQAGFKVHAIDRSMEAAIFQQKFWTHERVEFTQADLMTTPFNAYDAAVSIETIEHIPWDKEWIDKLRQHAKVLVATVPNQSVVAYDRRTHPFHYRHYTKDEFAALLTEGGWHVRDWWTQFGKWVPDEARMRPGDEGMTLGAVCL